MHVHPETIIFCIITYLLSQWELHPLPPCPAYSPGPTLIIDRGAGRLYKREELLFKKVGLPETFEKMCLLNPGLFRLNFITIVWGLRIC